MTNLQNWHDYPGTPQKWKKEFAPAYRFAWNPEYDESVWLRNDMPHAWTFTIWIGPSNHSEMTLPTGWNKSHLSVRVVVPANGELEVPKAWVHAIHQVRDGRIVSGRGVSLRVVQRSADDREQDVTPPIDGALANAMKPPSAPGKPRRRVRPVPEAPRE